MPLCQKMPPHIVNIFLLLGHALDDASFIGKGPVLTVLFLSVVWSIFFMHRILFSEGYFQAAAPVNCLCASPVTTCLIVVVVVVVVVVIIIMIIIIIIIR